MKIKSMYLENFRCFNNLNVNFSEQLTVITGECSTGKTSLLDGIAVGLGSLFLGFDGVNSRNIRSDDVRIQKVLGNPNRMLDQQYPVTVSCTGSFNSEEDVTWSRTLLDKDSRTTRKEASNIIEYANQLQRKVEENEATLLPLIAYYGSRRTTSFSTNDVPNVRSIGYVNCLSPILNSKFFTNWLWDLKVITQKTGEKPSELFKLEEILKTCFQGVFMEEVEEVTQGFEIDYCDENDEVLVTLGDGRILPFRMLSEGYKRIIGILADIAFRISVLNPQLQEKSFSEVTGVVLIDEIDLHLHPKYQRKIIEFLRSTFPNIQFIVTTNSPFIIQSIQSGELRILNEKLNKNNNNIIQYGEITNNRFFVAVPDYVDKSIEDITENILGINLPQWSERKNKMYLAAESYFKLLKEMEHSSQEQLNEYKQKLDELSKPYIDNVAYYAFLNQNRLRVEGNRREKE
ncbi:AAA family ATPase [Halalkalibacter flavus]|uniref:AAA family ATPase n=1 Tax=Halalkalibacter flavus TaxID=3090668 RepID=UPI002FCA99E3